MADDQIELLLTIVRDVLHKDVVGAYLHGSAVLGGLRPRSDLDVMVVSRRRTNRAEKQQLISQLLAHSRQPRPLELKIVVKDEIRPWRYPPRMDFQYGDWWRSAFQRGELEPWPSATNPDLASLVRMVLLGNTPLLGPPPREIFERVPRRDYVEALVHGIGGLLQTVESDTCNVVLTMARIWSGVLTDEVHSKDAAAEWALPRLPAQHRGVLIKARAMYLGDEKEDWEDLHMEARAYADHVAAEIKGLPRVTSFVTDPRGLKPVPGQVGTLRSRPLECCTYGEINAAHEPQITPECT
jgi:predicted nucleotidyltransferase